MKTISKSIFSFFLLLVLTLIFSCAEVYDDVKVEAIPLLDTTFLKSTPSPKQDKVVLLEEFTGVRCTNCPGAHRKAKELDETIFPGKVNIIAYHPTGTSFTVPYEDDDFNFASDEAKLIATFADVNTYPNGMIDRKVNSRGDRKYSVQAWQQEIEAELAQNNPVNITQKMTYDPVAKKNILKIEVEFNREYDKKVALSSAMIENGLKATQLDGGDKIKGYEHAKSFRKFVVYERELKMPSGKTTYPKGQTYVLDFYIEKAGTPIYTNIDKTYLVSFVKEMTNSTILQSNKIKAK